MNTPKLPEGCADWADLRARMILVEMFGEFETAYGGVCNLGNACARDESSIEAAPLVRTIAGHLRVTALSGPCLPSCNHPVAMRRTLSSAHAILWCRVCGAHARADADSFDNDGRIVEANLVWNAPLGRVVPPESP
jgi:hypothetical protein